MIRVFMLMCACGVAGPAMALPLPSLPLLYRTRDEGRVWRDDITWQRIERAAIDSIEQAQDREIKAGLTNRLMDIRRWRLEDSLRQPSPAELAEIQERAAINAEIIAALAADREFVAKLRDLIKRQQELVEKGHKQPTPVDHELLDLMKKKLGQPKQ